MRLLCFGLIALVTTASLTSARSKNDPACGETRCKWTCLGEACDNDGKANGTCRFGEKGGKGFELPVGKTITVPNSCGVLGTFSCRPSR
jgi:hypothetical protein